MRRRLRELRLRRRRARGAVLEGRGGGGGGGRRYLTVAFVGGVVAGLLVWSAQMRRCRRDLFSRSPIRRFAALGYLGGQPGIETAQLLNDYLRWETKPVLRKRAERLLKRMQSYLA